MLQEEWRELLRRQFNMPHGEDWQLDDRYTSWVQKLGGWDVGIHIANTAFEMGMQTASLALAIPYVQSTGGERNGVLELVKDSKV